MTFEQIRPTTSMLFQLIDEGVIDPVMVAKQALMWLEERDVKRMAEVNEFLPYPCDKEEVE